MRAARQLWRSALLPLRTRSYKHKSSAAVEAEANTATEACCRPKLPHDILEMIIAVCDLPTLANWAGTSKAYQEEAEKWLYRSIDLHAVARLHAYPRRGTEGEERADRLPMPRQQRGQLMPVSPVAASCARSASDSGRIQRARHVKHLIVGGWGFQQAFSTLHPAGLRCFTRLQSITLQLGDSRYSLLRQDLEQARRLFASIAIAKGDATLWHLEIRQSRAATCSFPPGWTLATLTRSQPNEVHLSFLSAMAAQPHDHAGYLAALLGRQPRLERLTITTLPDDSFFEPSDTLQAAREGAAYAAGVRSTLARLFSLSAGADYDRAGGQLFPALQEVHVRVPQSRRGRELRESAPTYGSIADNGCSHAHAHDSEWWTPRDSLHAILEVQLWELMLARRVGDGESNADREASENQRDDRLTLDVRLVPV